MSNLKTSEYTIYLENVQAQLSHFLSEKRPEKLFILVDENTEKLCLPLIQPSIEPFNPILLSIQSGEINKNIETCKSLWSELLTHHCDRHSVMLNLGGGVIGDMGGFVASTFMRGIDFCQIPTTLLSMVDASIGGKLGVDHDNIKNIVGLFNDPSGVFVNTSFLKTLSDRQLKSGFAEIIKHAFIGSDEPFSKLSFPVNEITDWPELVKWSIEIKKEVVEADQFEKGNRKVLNFGHTIGHAIESLYLDTTHSILHGEAVAAGMICALFLSHQKCGLKSKKMEDGVKYLTNQYQPLPLESKNYDPLLSLMRSDKKNFGGSIRFSLLKDFGQPNFDQSTSDSEIKDSLDFYCSLNP